VLNKNRKSAIEFRIETESTTIFWNGVRTSVRSIRASKVVFLNITMMNDIVFALSKDNEKLFIL